MPNPMQSTTRVTIRQSIGDKLGDIIVSEVSITKDTSSLWDTYALQKGGTDEYIGRQVQINTPVGSIVAGEKSFVSAFNATDKDCTMAPAFTANLTDGDTYEMWNIFRIEEINREIDDAYREVSARCLQERETHDSYTDKDIYEYAILTSFQGLYRVEYVYNTLIDHLLSDCETAWTAGSSVTATADTAFKRLGNASAKLVVADGAAAGGILGYDTIGSIDISDADRLEFDMYSTIALSAAELDFVLSASAAIAATTESLDIPAMNAATWYRHSIALANPESDTAIISLGLVNTTDVGACTLYIDNVRAVKDGSKQYREVPPEYWSIAKGSTNYLKFDKNGKGLIGEARFLRLSGYELPTMLTTDSTVTEIDSDYIIAQVVGTLLVGHAKSSRLDIEDRIGKSEYWLEKAEKLKTKINTQYRGSTRWIT